MSKYYLKIAKKAIVALTLAACFISPYSALARIPNDPGYSYQRSVWNQIGAPEAWEYSTGSADTIVAVIDTGADTWHDDLSSNVWINTKEIPDNNVDDDTNGFIDDVNGWNFVENSNDVRTSVFDSQDDAEAVRHGTVIAGLIGAVGNNSRNGTGINWSVKIMSLRAIASNGTGAYSNLRRSVEYAMDNGADVITMSFTGESNSEQLKQILYQAYQKGIVIVAAAGNHGDDNLGDLDAKPSYPACFDKNDTENWILTVGSVDTEDVVSSFSDYGRCLDIMAPGEGIFSTERYAPQYGYSTAFGGEWRGTSFAAPIVAGAAALLKSFRPDWKAQQIIPALLASVDPIESRNPTFAGKIGKGRLNIAGAIKLAAESASYNPLGSLYSVSGTKIKQFSLATGDVYDFATLPGSSIISVAATPDDSSIAVLYRRGSILYVRLLSSDGRFVSETILPYKHSATRTAKRVRLAGADGLSVILEQYDSRKKVTTFTSYDALGERQSQFEVAGSVVQWDTATQANAMVYAQIAKNVVTLRQVNFSDNTKQSFTIKGVSQVHDLRIAPIDPAGGEQVAFLSRQGNEVFRYTVSIDGEFFRKDYIGSYDAKNPWRLRLVYYPTSPVYLWLPFKGVGAFSVMSGEGKLISSVIIPAGFGQVVY